MFTKIFAALRSGGSFWIFDMIEQSTPPMEKLMRDRYAHYLSTLKGGGDAGAAYVKTVFDYIEEEDTPKPLHYQLQLLSTLGFTDIDVLHKNALFAAFGARKPCPYISLNPITSPAPVVILRENLLNSSCTS